MSKFGLPEGEKDTAQLRTRFNNYVKDKKKKGEWGSGEHERHLHAQNAFYEFNKPQYDSKKKEMAGKMKPAVIKLGQKAKDDFKYTVSDHKGRTISKGDWNSKSK